MLAIERILGHPCSNKLAVLSAGYPGPLGAQAIAEAVFGTYSPGGKLSNTWYPATYVDDVSMTSMSMTASPGRSYKYYEGRPTFTFGHGLSYTTFDLSVVGETHLYADTHQQEPLTIEVSIKNTGSVHGDEVVQVYSIPRLLDLPSPLPPMAKKELVAFKRISLASNESATISLQVYGVRARD